MSSTEDEADVVIVGGGPCGLALAIGLRQLGHANHSPNDCVCGSAVVPFPTHLSQ